MAREEAARAGRAIRGRVRAVVLSLALPLLASLNSYASTPAGTVVTNAASAFWEGGTAASEPASFTVAQLADVAVDPPAAEASALTGSSLHYPAHIINRGNGPDRFVLGFVGEQGWPGSIYRDDNGDGLHQESETVVVSVTEVLAPWEQFPCVVVVSVPQSAAGSERSWLTASSEADPRVQAYASYTSLGLTRPTAQFGATPTSGPAPLQVSFEDQSSGGPTSWTWDFGDGGASSEQHPRHEYGAAGSYSVTLTVGSANGADTAVQADCITVLAAPSADFAALPINGTAPLSVEFRDLSAGGPTAWQWSFGDDSSSSKQNPAHRYSKAGTYTVSLTVTTPAGTVTTTKPGCIVVDFRDVPHGHWAYKYVMSAIDAGLITGYPDATYHPQQAVTRDQMATFIARALAGGDPEVPDGPDQPSFADVSPAHWAYRYVEYAAAWRVANGFPGGSFGPARTVDRAQMAAFVARSVALLEDQVSVDSYQPPTVPTFRDVPPGHWAYRFVEYNAGKGLTTGYPDGSYQPEAACTRDQMAVYLARAFGVGP